MNKRALYLGISYSILVIVYKLIILLGGYQLTKFGFYYSHFLSVAFILPFMIIAIKLARDNDNGGVISGKDAVKVGLGVFGISVIILSAYTYIEFEWKLREISVQYYNSAEYLEFLKKQTKITPEMYPKIIEENTAALSAMKAVTAKLFSFFLLSFAFAFITAVFMKKR
ncbi:MAG: DUF4199 domain-containing protein [Sphingobacteriaceae bacterium]|nr:DUF4199 domain-containing protein [Sphingobacteriaceae bacterium]